MARPKSMVLFGTLMCGMFYSKMAQVYKILRRCTYIIRMRQKNYQSVHHLRRAFSISGFGYVVLAG